MGLEVACWLSTRVYAAEDGGSHRGDAEVAETNEPQMNTDGPNGWGVRSAILRTCPVFFPGEIDDLLVDVEFLEQEGHDEIGQAEEDEQ